MRNLVNIKHAAYQLNSDLPLTAHAWDTASESLICAFGPTADKEVIELRRVQDEGARSRHDTTLIASWDAPCPLPELAVDKVVDLHHFGYNETSCLVLAGGDIVVIRSQPLPGQDKIEIVGSVDAGITAASWSPDGEVLAVATGADTMIFMTAEFDSVANVSFNPEDSGLSKHVNVGWGKKETQFQGKRAKALRDPTMPEYVDEGSLSTCDRGQVVISWRGDGAYVAVNSIENKSRRMIRVFSREGVLDSVTEPVDGLEGALSWRPSGNLMAGVQRKENSIDVVFFERNGLRHGNFSLRLSSEDMELWGSDVSLSWNCDSSALAVTFKDRVQIWTMGNYHYYLKQEERFEIGNEATRPELVWHPEQPLRLSVAPPGGGVEPTNHSLRVLEYVSSVSRGSTVSPNDFGMVPVLDGLNLKLTPLRVGNVPPPIALHELKIEAVARDVSVNMSNTRIAVLHGTSFSVIKYEVRSPSSSIEEPTIERIEDLPVSDFIVARQICYKGDDELLVLMTNLLTNESIIYDCTDQVEAQIPDQLNVLSLFPSIGQDALFLTTENSVQQIVSIENSEGYTTLAAHTGLSASATWVEVVHIGERTIAFALTTTGTLYANERQLVRNCTSFVLTTSHLIFTASNHLLKFVHLNSSVAELQIPLDEPEIDERCRSVERGAKLVTVMPSTYSVVLQMPRGNLETIYPRALVLAGIRRNVEKKQYRKAFLACRSQRVDMNIIHDHAPSSFLGDISLFVDQIKRVDFIDLFLSQLRDEDVSRTMYKDTVPQQNGNDYQITTELNNTKTSTAEDEKSFSTTGKVNRICDAFLAVLRDRYNTNLQNVITAHVCKLPPNIEAGLTVVSELRETQPNLSDAAVEHICFLVDVNRVYDSALGMYNLDLALLVAQQSQKDPREYLPYLQSIQELPQLRQRFKIDDDLSRHAKALQHLYNLKAIEELQTYTKKHELYSDALELYRYDETTQASIMRLYADFLVSRNQPKEAAIAYTSLSLHNLASSAYRSANLWRECLTSALLVPLSAQELTSLASDLAEHLIETRDHAAAAIIYLDHLSDLPSALRSLCRAHAFTDATRLAALHAQTNLIADVITPGIIEASAALTETLADCKAQLNAQLPRLRELRHLKTIDPLAFFEGTVTGAQDIPDNVSIAPSATSTAGGASLFTRYTGAGASGTLASNATRKTSKNKRREERKRARGKKGSVYEEEYLVNSVGRLIERVNGMNADVEATVEACLGRMGDGMRERGRAVAELMAEVMGICEGCVVEVWEVGAKVAPSNEAMAAVVNGARGGEEEEYRPQGGDAVLWESLEQSWRKNGPPSIKPFQRSRLL